MASIKINNLQPAGSNLFNDSESYLSELTETELNTNNGGLIPTVVIVTVVVTTLITAN